MAVESAISEEKKKEWLSQEWYLNRFDGCPFLLSFIGMGETLPEGRKHPWGHGTVRLAFFYSHKVDWHMPLSDIRRAAGQFMRRSTSDPYFTLNLMRLWEADEEKFEKMWAHISSADSQKPSNGELLALFNSFVEASIKRVTSSSLIDGFAFGSDEAIAGKVRAHLEELGKAAEFGSIFTALTAHVHPSFTTHAELSLLKAAIIAQKEGAAETILNNTPKEAMQKLLAFPKTMRALLDHQSNFHWLRNNYIDGEPLPPEHFIEEISTLLRSGKDLQKEFGELKSIPLRNLEEKEKLMDELQLPIELRSLIRYSEDFTLWQDERKRSTFFMAHAFSFLLREIGKRCGFTLGEMKYLVPEEVPLAAAGKIPPEVPRARIKGCMVAWEHGRISILTGPEVQEMHAHFRKAGLPEETDVVKGLAASLGKARGTARIVNSSREIDKVNEGDILVAVMTRPVYILGMKRAAAIVTDEGGLTCHAAIVARELKIPCIIGTKFATRVLKDGSEVEVDASKGEVRVLTAS